MLGQGGTGKACSALAWLSMQNGFTLHACELKRHPYIACAACNASMRAIANQQPTSCSTSPKEYMSLARDGSPSVITSGAASAPPQQGLGFSARNLRPVAVACSPVLDVELHRWRRGLGVAFVPQPPSGAHAVAAAAATGT